MSRLSAFFAFWYDFIIGDDWRVAVGVIAALAATYGLSSSTTIPAWWLLPTAVLILLPLSLWRAARPAPASGRTRPVRVEPPATDH